MARRKKRKPMTVTQKFNRLVKGLKFFGLLFTEKKRATTKQLKELQKTYQKTRKQLREEEPNIELPTITQAAKYVEEQERQEQEPQITREPLPYNDTDYTPEIDFASNVLDNFIDDIQEAMTELAGTYGLVPQIWNTLSKQHAEIIQIFNTLKETIGEENLANYISQSDEYDKITTVTKLHYGQTIEVFDNIITNLNGILREAQDYYTSETPQTFNSGINFDNI